MKTFREICAGLFAGAFIALGCCGYVMTGNYVVGAVLFAVALLMIKQYDLCLFTGRVGRIHTVDEGVHCFIILLLNMVGCILIFFIIQSSNALTNNLARVYIAKITYTNWQMFLMAIPCGFLMSFAARKETTQIQTIMCVALFVICGFEHCIADCFYLLPAITLGHFNLFIQRFIMTVCGNIIGATLGSRWLGGFLNGDIQRTKH